MGFKYNFWTGTFDLVEGGGTTTWLSPVANRAALPSGDADGSARSVLDEDTVFIYDSGSDTWHNTRLSPTEFSATANSAGITISADTTAGTPNITDYKATLHAADASNPGGVSTGIQSFAGNKTFTGDVTIQGTLNVDNQNVINSTTTEIQDPNITVNKGGTQATANTAVSGLTTEMSDAIDARIGYDSTAPLRYKAGEVGSEDNLVGETATQTITNKTIDANNNTISNLAHGAEVDNPSSGVHGVTGNVVGTTDTQTLQNKTIDGTAATGNNTVTIDASDASYDNSTSGLTATDSQAAIDEVEGRLDTAESDITGKADRDLGNLTSPTAINQHLLPDGDLTRDLGDFSSRFEQGHFGRLRIGDASNTTLAEFAVAGTARGHIGYRDKANSATGASFAFMSVSPFTNVLIASINDGGSATKNINVETGNNTGSGNSGNIVIQTGTAGTGDTGDITIETGASTSGTRGVINLNADDVFIPGKLTVTGGIDPEYLQLDPQAGGGSIPNNSIWVDSSDSNKFKFKNNGGTSNEVITGDQLGAANGVATLDGGGKVPAGQLPNSIMSYIGTWNASTNTPTLADGVGNADEDIGNVYRVSVAGTQDLGSGSQTFVVGDYVILNNSKVWEKSDTTDAVASVNGQTGVVVLDADDIDDAATSHKFASQAQLNKVDFLTVTQAVDLDTMESDTAANNAKVSADGSVTTHSDVTNAGSGAIITGAERTKLSGIESGATADQSAAEVPYTNTTSGLTATDVQAAIDEVEGRVDTNDAKVSADGSVTTHSDVSSAGSGQIITGTERTTLGTALQPGDASTQLDHTQTTPTDWTVANGATVGAHLDEVGGRLTTNETDINGLQSSVEALYTNFIKNPLFNDGIADVTDTANVTTSHETTTPLVKGGSLKAETTSSATTADYFELDMNDIDPAYLGRLMQIHFEYSTDGNYSSDDYEVVLYNVDSATETSVSVLDNDNSLLATSGLTDSRKFTAIVQIDDTDNTYRLRFKVKNAPASTSTILVDNVVFTPQITVPGSALQNAIPFTPTWNNITIGNASQDFEYARFGEYMLIKGNFTFGSTSSFTGAISMNVPGGWTAVPRLTNSICEGVAHLFDTSTAANAELATVALNPSLEIGFIPNGSNSFVDGTNPFTWTTNDRISVTFFVKIEEWTSGACLSTHEANVSTAKARIYLGSNQTGIGTSITKAQLDTVEYDTHNMADTVNNRITVPKDGQYTISAKLRTSNGTANDETRLRVRKNGLIDVLDIFNNPNATSMTVAVSDTVPLEKGDYLELFTDSGTDASYDLINGIRNNYLSVVEQPDFNVFSVYGKQEYLEVSASSSTQTVSADTWIDVTGMSLILTPGTWDVGYDVSAFFNWNAGSNIGVTGNVGIYDSSNVLVGNTISVAYAVMSSANEQSAHSMSRNARITITETTTIKLRIRSNFAAASATFDLLANGLSAGITDPDNHSNLWARRVS